MPVGRRFISPCWPCLRPAPEWSGGGPLSIGGPMRFDFNLPIGLVCLAGGSTFLEIVTAPRWVYVFAALLVLFTAAPNFYEYPPIDDGAYFLLRYGRNALDNWAPPEPFAPMFAFDVAGWAAARAFSVAGSCLIRLGVFVLGAAASCAIYEVFMRNLIGGAGSRQLWLVLAGLVLLAGGCAGWAGRSDAARIGLGLAAMTALVSLTSWALYTFTV